MSDDRPTSGARAGDWIEVRGVPGAPTRKGQIVEVLGRPGHERFRVRWDEAHESILYPSEGASMVHHAPRRRPRS